MNLIQEEEINNMKIEDFAEKQSHYTGRNNKRKWIIKDSELLKNYLIECNYQPSILAKKLGTSYATVKRFLNSAGLWELAKIKPQSTWSSGRKRTAIKDKFGYLYASSDYDFRNERGEIIRRYEHHIQAEKMLGRSLANNEMVHHINLDKTDNNPKNLLVCDNSVHQKVHHDLEALAGRLMQAGLITFIPELQQYTYVGPQLKLERLYSDGSFIKVMDVLGSDATVVNSARISFGKRINEIREQDKKLLDYLAKNGHTSPFRHCYVQFHIKAPEFIARQWYKHIIGSEYSFKDQPWNEISGRYVKYETEFWLPDHFRKQATDNKQGSINEPPENEELLLKSYKDHVRASFELYNKLVESGVAKEQARTILPISFFTEWYWTASLQTIHHFCKLRNDPNAQIEIKTFAIDMEDFMNNLFPNAWRALMQSPTK